MDEAILVPLDGSELAEQALPPAVELCRKGSASLHLVRALLWAPDSPLSTGEEAEYLDGVAERVAAELGRAATTAVLPETAKRSGDWPASARDTASHILEYAGRHEIGMLVMATHGRGGIARAWFGSVADAIIRASDLPVLLIRPDAAEETARPIRKVLVPLDAEPESRRALRAATSLATAFDASLTLLRVIPWPYQVYGTLTPVTVVGTGSDLDTARDHAREQLEQDAAEVRAAGLEVDVAVVEDVSPGRAIVAFAEENGIDLIALATHARKGFERMVLGSVADKVLRGAECPVLMVRSAD